MLLAENLLIGAINIENDEANKVKNQENGNWDSVPATAGWYKDHGIKWVVVGEFERLPLWTSVNGR